MHSLKQKVWKRHCPKCNCNIIYASYRSWWTCNKNGGTCKDCYSKRKIGTHLSKESIERIKSSKIGKTFSDEHKKKLSDAWNKRKKNYPITNETRKKISDKVKLNWKTPSIREKYNDALEKTKWLKVKTDKGQLEFINKWNSLGFNFEPNYQLHIGKFLCYVDGYDKEKNVVLEYDGKYHLKPNQKQKDLIRQEKIIEILKPKKFWRYNFETKKITGVKYV